MTTGLGVGVVPQDVRKRISRNTTPKMIASLTISGVDLLFNEFFMRCPSLRTEGKLSSAPIDTAREKYESATELPVKIRFKR